MAVIYTIATLALCLSFAWGIRDLSILKKKVNGRFSKSIAPNLEDIKWKP